MAPSEIGKEARTEASRGTSGQLKPPPTPWSLVCKRALRSSVGLRVLTESSTGVTCGALDEEAIGENGVERMILVLTPRSESGVEEFDLLYWESKAPSRSWLEEALLIK